MKVKDAPLFDQAYIDTGEGPVIILLHGLFGNLAMWQSTVNTLKKEFRVVVPRLPIFDMPSEHTNMLYLADVLQQFVEHHEFSDVTLVGHALGGLLALIYTDAHPGNVKGIVLVGSTGLIDKAVPAEELLADDSYLQGKVRDTFFKSTLVPEELVKKVVSEAPARSAVRAIYQSSRQINLPAILRKIDHRVLLLWGLDDRISPPETALHFYDFLANSDLKFIDRCGHVPMMEHPQEFNSYLIHFLNH